MFQCKDCLSIIRSREAYASHVQIGQDLRCPQCTATFNNVCSYQIHKFNEHRSPDRRIPFEVAHKASSSSTSSMSYTSAEENPQMQRSTSHQPNHPNLQVPKVTSSRGVTPADVAPTSQLISGLPACLPQPLYRFGESAIPLDIEALTRPTFNSPPVGELLDLDTEPAENEVEKLEGAIQALHSLVAGKRFVKEQPETQEEHHHSALNLDGMLGNTEVPNPAISEPPEVDNNIAVEERRMTGDVPTAIMGAIICFECETTFSTLIGLQHHQIMHGHNYCRLCNAFFVDGSLLKDHRDTVHNFRCAKCESRFDSWDGVMTHQRIARHCFCKECNCYFTDNESHRNHSESHDAATAALYRDEQLQPRSKYQRDNYTCERCRGVLADQASFDHHTKQAHIHGCAFPNCKFLGVTAEHLKTHQRRMNHYFCYTCDRGFIEQPGLISHQKSEKHLKKLREQQNAKT